MTARQPIAAATAATLAERILAKLKGHSSQRPARAEDIIALVLASGGDATAAWDTLATLIAQRQVCDALITKAGQPAYQAIWPTHIVPRTGGWTGSRHSGLFDRSRLPQRLPIGPRPDHDPRPDLGYATAKQRRAHAPTEAKAPAKGHASTRESAQRQQQIAYAVAGRPLSRAIKVADLADQFDVSAECIRRHGRQLEAQGLVTLSTIMSAGRRIAVAYDPRAVAEDKDAAEAPRVLRAPGQLRAELLAMLKGIDKAHALTAVAIAHRLPRPEGQTGPRHIAAYYDPKAASPEQPEPTPQPQAVRVASIAVPPALRGLTPDGDQQLTSAEHFVELEPGNAPDDRFHFALFDSGELGVLVGTHYLLLPPAAVRRLALLLGVPSAGGAAA